MFQSFFFIIIYIYIYLWYYLNKMYALTCEKHFSFTPGQGWLIWITLYTVGLVYVL